MLVFDYLIIAVMATMVIVSILVLVDVGLRQIIVIFLLLNKVSFNPCFSGCWSSTLQDLHNVKPI